MEPEDLVLSGMSSPGCLEHGLVGCARCAELLERVRSVAEARRKGNSVSEEAVTGVVDVAPPDSPPVTPVQPQSEVVRLAHEYTGLLTSLARERQLLLAAELRVEHLHASIAELTAAAESTKLSFLAALAE